MTGQVMMIFPQPPDIATYFKANNIGSQNIKVFRYQFDSTTVR